MTIANNDPDEQPYNFALRGVGAVPEARVLYMGRLVADNDTTPSAFEGTDFGGVPVGQTVSRTFEIENQGNAPLTLSNLRIVGENSGDFMLMGSPSGSVDEGGGTTVFMVEFMPSSVGHRYAGLVIESNDPDNDPYNFALRGIGLPNVEIDVAANSFSIDDGDATPSPADGTHFGTVTVGQSVQHTFTISNSDSDTLVLDGTPLVRVVGSHAADFEVTADPASTIASGGSTQFTVTFSPSAATTRYAALVIENNDPNEDPFNFAIRGIGVPDVDMAVTGNGNAVADNTGSTSASNNTWFGDVAVGDTVTKTFTIENTGNATLNLDGSPLVQVVGADAAAFTVTVLPSSSIAGGGSTMFQVEFAPFKTAAHYAGLVIRNNDPDEDPYNFAIRGRGTVAMMSAAEYAYWEEQFADSTDEPADDKQPEISVESTVSLNDAAFSWLEGQLVA